jgi:predicted GH43/DUF377 family glycosyl hydrolase
MCSPVSLTERIEPHVAPTSTLRIDTERLVAGDRGPQRRVFNWSAVRIADPDSPDRLLMAFRVETSTASYPSATGGDPPLKRSRIHLVEVCAGRPVHPSQVLDLGHHRGDVLAQEDPRLWWHRGTPHLSYGGVADRGRGPVSSIFYARLEPTDNGFDLGESHEPVYPERQAWEKNWAFFSHEDEIFAVHQIAPRHRVLHVHADTARSVAEIEWRSDWPHGDMRGGAPPIRVGDEYWHWFHGHERRPNAPSRYTTGIYTFAAQPPFAPRRICRVPVQMPPDGEGPDGEKVPNVVFVGGAYLEEGTWHLSYGLHDSWSEYALFDHSEVERMLQPV